MAYLRENIAESAHYLTLVLAIFTVGILSKVLLAIYPSVGIVTV